MLLAEAVTPDASWGPWMFASSLVFSIGGSLIAAILKFYPNRTKIVATVEPNGNGNKFHAGDSPVSRALVELLNKREEEKDALAAVAKAQETIVRLEERQKSLDQKVDGNFKQQQTDHRQQMHFLRNIMQAIAGLGIKIQHPETES